MAGGEVKGAVLGENIVGRSADLAIWRRPLITSYGMHRILETRPPKTMLEAFGTL